MPYLQMSWIFFVVCEMKFTDMEVDGGISIEHQFAFS